MELTRVKDRLWVPTDFKKYHGYYADEKGDKEYTGVTSVLGVVAKPNLIPWASNENTRYIKEHAPFIENSDRREDDNDFIKSLHKKYLVSPELLEEARTAHTKKKEAAGEHGTGAHELVEEWVNLCLSPEANPISKGAPVLGGEKFAPIRPFIDWAGLNVDRFLFSERRMCDPALWLAGTCDLAYIDKEGRRVISDFKTNSAIYYEMWMQTAAYQHMAELEDEKYDRRSVVRLGKKGDFEVQWREDFDTDWEAFKACLVLYRAQRTFTTLARR